MYAKAKVGGFLHLAIGEEATIVGSARAMRDDDYLISTYRSHGHAIVRGTSPSNVMAELFGRVDGCSKGRGGSMHMFDLERRFMGGYGIVGGNLPISVGLGSAPTTRRPRTRALPVRRRRRESGHVRRGAQPRRAVEAPGRLHGHEQPVRHGHRARAPLRRHRPAQARRRLRRPRHALRRHGRLDTYAVTREALKKAREDRQPVLVEAITYRFRGHSMADPEEYRTKEQVEEWRKRDPVATFGERLVEEEVLTEDDLEKLDKQAIARSTRRSASPTRGPHPSPSRSTTTSTCSATRCAAGTPSTSAPPACTAARTSATMRRTARAASSSRPSSRARAATSAMPAAAGEDWRARSADEADEEAEEDASG